MSLAAVDEIATINESVALIEQKLGEAEAAQAELQENKRRLEQGSEGYVNRKTLLVGKAALISSGCRRLR